MKQACVRLFSRRTTGGVPCGERNSWSGGVHLLSKGQECHQRCYLCEQSLHWCWHASTIQCLRCLKFQTNVCISTFGKHECKARNGKWTQNPTAKALPVEVQVVVQTSFHFACYDYIPLWFFMLTFRSILSSFMEKTSCGAPCLY